VTVHQRAAQNVQGGLGREPAPEAALGLAAQVRKNLLDDRLLQHCRDHLQIAAAVRAVRHLEAEHAVDASDVRVIN